MSDQMRQSCLEIDPFLYHAEESTTELKAQAVLSADLGFCSPTEAAEACELIQELGKLLNTLRRS